MAEDKKYTFEDRKEYAKKIIEGMAADGLTYADARLILKHAQEEIGKQMSNGKVKASQ